MSMTSCYPVLMTTQVAAAADFFREHFGFRTTFEADWYVSLAHEGGELAFVQLDHPTVPGGFQAPASGVLVNLEVDDVDSAYQRLVVDGPLRAVQELRSEEFGQRHFIVAAPGEVLVDVITEIPIGGPAEPGEAGVTPRSRPE